MIFFGLVMHFSLRHDAIFILKVNEFSIFMTKKWLNSEVSSSGEPWNTKIWKNWKKFFCHFCTPGASLRGARSTAWGRNIKKRLDDVTCFAVAVICAKFHQIRPSGFLWTVFGFEIREQHLQIGGILYVSNKAVCDPNFRFLYLSQFSSNIL